MNLREEMQSRIYKIGARHETDRDVDYDAIVDELVQVAHTWALEMVGDDEDILPTDTPIEWITDITKGQLTERKEIRQRIKEATK